MFSKFYSVSIVKYLPSMKSVKLQKMICCYCSWKCANTDKIWRKDGFSLQIFSNWDLFLSKWANDLPILTKIFSFGEKKIVSERCTFMAETNRADHFPDPHWLILKNIVVLLFLYCQRKLWCVILLTFAISYAISLSLNYPEVYIYNSMMALTLTQIIGQLGENDGFF